MPKSVKETTDTTPKKPAKTTVAGVEKELLALGCDTVQLVEDKDVNNLHAIVTKGEIKRIVTVPYDTLGADTAETLFAKTGF